MYHSSPGFHALENHSHIQDRHRETRRRVRNNGSEAARAVPVGPRLKSLFALIALVVNGGLAFLAWNAGFVGIAVFLGAIAVLMIVDLGWQRYKISREPEIPEFPWPWRRHTSSGGSNSGG